MKKQMACMGAVGCLLLTLFCVPWVEKAGAAEKPIAKGAVLKALEEEMQRAKQILAQKGSPPPYFIGYQVTEIQSTTIAATRGALRSSDTNRFRFLDVDVRVGAYDLDNTHQIRGQRVPFEASALAPPTAIPIEDDVDAIKSVIWLETDRRYKQAVENLIKVKTNRAVMVAEDDQSPDFSRERPQMALLASASLNPNAAEWEKKARELSALFKRYPIVLDSEVRFSADSTTRYIVNSEGTSVQDQSNHARLSIIARTKAADGMDLFRFESFDAHSLDRLPDEATTSRTIEKLAKDLAVLRTAPVIEPYTGPAILSGRASGVFFHEIFGHRIEGHRQKDAEGAQTFTRQVGQPVLPDFISVYDDPTAERVAGIDLNGTYDYDDEGVKAERVTVVEKGVLKNFLMSRSPVKGFDKSNGHGRKSVGYRAVGRQGNLIVQSSKKVSEAKLREMLIEEVKRQGKPYGLLFADISGGFTFTGRGTPQAFQVTPVMVYRVYPDGRPDELVRGAELIGTPLTSFSRIIASSDKEEVFNGICGAESGWVPVSAVSPGILTTQIEVQKSRKASDRPPILPPPDADKLLNK